ncbi:hypothetical protein IMG5_161730 [Ichthyophthirius multifiliis]|uniref:ABC transporter family protein n=1 Tax=Ichthyophthirius multifiliis TaxID=5932 RepID=G0R038_ICHMU|nr:hypothetical protein IMG5_161730 [Ichthyophthirius multifiliis]EGR29164.1 hypothetical protein IMG5_161730 [Ichthyophthirius multifiliis]|eukprot:XP_004030400.1 hypothetical protein IMG5_161730 [Ichthyophthirius multifiliis]
MLPWNIATIIKSKMSYDRIYKFLNQKDIDVSNINYTNENQIAIEINNIVFNWPNNQMKKNKKQKQNTKNMKLTQPLINEIDNLNIDIDKNFILQIENLQILKGSITYIIGKSGSGKTALINSILNEMDSYTLDNQISLISDTNQSIINKQKGINISGTIAYVSQNHWLVTKSIKENILMGKAFDQEFYTKCIDVCELRQDLANFDNYDEHLVGPNGDNLSGGQKQRISLCRAVYQDKQIYLLDDIFSSLDFHVCKNILQKCVFEFLNGKGKTIIMTINQFGIIFGQNSDIIIDTNQFIYLEEGKIIKEEQRIESFIRNGIKKSNEAKEEYEKRKLNQIKEEQDNEKKYNTESKDNILIEKNEEKREQGIKKDTILVYFKSMNFFCLFMFLIFNFLMHASQIIIDFWLRDYIFPSSPLFHNLNILFNNQFSMIFILLIFLNLFLTILRAFFYIICALLSCQRISKRLNKFIIFSKMTFFDKNPYGRIINRLSDDVTTVDDPLPWSCHVIMEQASYVLGYQIGIAIQFPWILIIFLFIFYLSYKIQKKFRVSNREIKRLNSVNQGVVLTHLSESCKGVVLIRSFNNQKYMNKEYLQKLSLSNNSFLLTQAIYLWMVVRLLLISNLSLLFVGVSSIFIILGKFSIQYNTVAMCLTYSMLWSSRLANLINIFCQAESNMISMERISQYFHNPQENLNAKIGQNQNSQEIQAYQQCGNEQYVVQFKNVMFTYNNINKVKQQYALKNFNLAIKKGEKIAICGRTGSGKTSVLNALFNMYNLESGDIFLNSVNIKSMTLSELRQQISIIPQFGFLFNASLKDNIDPQNQYSKEQIQEKTQNINLFIRNQKDYDFVIQDDNLSNGEKQIINFLRIAIKDTQIVCLDEATSNIDAQTDQKLHEQLFEYTKDKTLIVITHRLENIHHFDRICVLDNGEILEQGNIEQLKQNTGGFFNRITNQQ